jgi:hypothetical protein
MKKSTILALLFGALFFGQAQGQLLKDILDGARKAAQTANTINETANSISETVSTLKMTTAEFNKTVRVIKGNSNTGFSGKVTELKIKNGRANLGWEPIVLFDNQLFPSVIISMAHYRGELPGAQGDAIKSSGLGFVFGPTQANLSLRWEIECTEKKYFDKQSGTIVIPASGQNTCFMPPIPWNYTSLGKNLTSTPISMHFRLFDEKGNKVEQLQSVTMRSINDCLLEYKQIDMKFLLAAYVNEDHPEIDKILREGLNTGMVNSWHGYQGSVEDVHNQVATIWQVLHERGFQYSSITKNSGAGSENLFSQTVRSFDNALKTNQANCVDGTVVFASILKRIGITPLFVLVPGHCFLGYVTEFSKDGKVVDWAFLETTMLSSSKVKVVDPKSKKEYLLDLANAKNQKEKNFVSWQLFAGAREKGLLAYKEADQNGNAQLIVIDREKVQPIPVYE